MESQEEWIESKSEKSHMSNLLVQDIPLLAEKRAEILTRNHWTEDGEQSSDNVQV